MGKDRGNYFNPEIMTPKDVAEYLKLPLSTVYKLSQEGTLLGTKFGKHWRYLKSDIDAHLNNLAMGMMSGKPSERRRCPRIVCSLPASFQIHVPELKDCSGEGRVRNIGLGGALLEIDSLNLEGQLLSLGDPLAVEVSYKEVDGGTGKRKLEGEIVRLEQGERTALWVKFAKTSLETADEVIARLAG